MKVAIAQALPCIFALSPLLLANAQPVSTAVHEYGVDAVEALHPELASEEGLFKRGWSQQSGTGVFIPGQAQRITIPKPLKPAKNGKGLLGPAPQVQRQEWQHKGTSQEGGSSNSGKLAQGLPYPSVKGNVDWTYHQQ